LAVMRAFSAQYMILEKDHVHGLDALYNNPGDRPGLTYLGVQDGVQLYKFGSKP
jgi:hypothetical protein